MAASRPTMTRVFLMMENLRDMCADQPGDASSSGEDTAFGVEAAANRCETAPWGME
jgi:hypothetical protein